jgi:hypothetical protein
MSWTSRYLWYHLYFDLYPKISLNNICYHLIHILSMCFLEHLIQVRQEGLCHLWQGLFPLWLILLLILRLIIKQVANIILWLYILGCCRWQTIPKKVKGWVLIILRVTILWWRLVLVLRHGT